MSPAPILPESIDLSHHLAKRIRTVQPSAMKALGALVGNRKLLTLGGGTPHPSLFPMSHATFTLPKLSTLNGDVQDWQIGQAVTEEIHLKKTGPGTENDEGGILDLNDILQYGLSNGYPELINQLEELNGLLHGKTTSDQSVYISLGNTDGVSKVFQLLVEPDVDTVLTEEYSFASSLNSARAKGAKLYPVKVDGQGLIPEDLEKVLSTWDEKVQGRKPHLLYTIPCGQNPTGTTQPQERYDEIYRICHEHDVIIMEDDPYYPLQFAEYEPDQQKREAQLEEARAKLPPAPENAKDDDAQAVAKVFNEYAGVRSYLSRDVDGRVIRIDTFSKVFGPGVRLGWITANSTFIERILRIGETTTQVPNGLSQSVLASYLSDKHWGIGGFIRWMWGVRLEYQLKRDFFLDKLNEYVPKDLVTTVPCGAGMFQWLKVEVSSHPRYRKTLIGNSADAAVNLALDTAGQEPEVAPGLRLRQNIKAEEKYSTNTGELIDELWNHLIEHGKVVLLPAKVFHTETPDVDSSDRLNFFRATFAGDLENIDAALKAFGDSIKEWFAKG
uniref:Aminotransferase class I/classII large domain-containing protein n=1 Tax=Kwoniella pini CBS 10737 TaxID=1296096 RepID=A0A1B9HU60_9TREE|nr:uncharacterized protein I206_07192 [Kwoniella pini CBS 10737]OCF46805.1 hypothetical protein I206_07192 [Kwoniella pini CBS 10737]